MSSGEIRAGKAYVEIGLKGHFKRDLDEAAKKLKEFGERVSEIGKRVGEMGLALLGPLTAAALAAAVMGKEIQEAHEKTGMLVSSLQTLKYAAEETGSSLQAVTDAVRHMQQYMIQAANGSTEATMGLHQLGLTIANLRGLSPDNQFRLIAERLAAIESPAQRSALAVAIFGRSALELIPMMKRLEELEAHAKALGIVMGDDDVRAADRFGEVLDDLKEQFKAITFQVGLAVGKAFEPFADKLRDILPKVIAFAHDHEGLTKGVVALGAALVVTGGSLVIFGQSIRLVGSSILGVTSLFKTGFALIGSFVSLGISAVVASFGLIHGAIMGIAAAVPAVLGGLAAAFTFLISPIGLVVVAIAAAAAGILLFTNAGSKGLHAIGVASSDVGKKIKSVLGSAISHVMTVFEELKTTALETFHGIADALGAGDISLAAQILWTGLKLAWVEGTEGLMNKWYDFSAEFKKVAIGTFYSVETAWTKVQSGLKSSWSSMTASLGSVWDAVVGTMEDVWGDLTAAVRKTINEVHAAYAWMTGGTYTAGADNQAIDDARIKKENDRRKQEMAQEAQREKDEINAQKIIAQEREQALKEIADRQQQLSKIISEGEKKALKKKIDDLTKQLDDLTKKAQTEHHTFTDQKKAEDAKDKDTDTGGDMLPPDKGTARAIGMFNIAGIRGFAGGSSTGDRIAKATEQTARNTSAFGKAAQSNPKAFTAVAPALGNAPANLLSPGAVNFGSIPQTTSDAIARQSMVNQQGMNAKGDDWNEKIYNVLVESAKYLKKISDNPAAFA